jgi:hypothetical protein
VSCPGLGPLRVAQLIPIVVSPMRFRTKRQFWSYCGLGIVMRSSSDWVRTKDGGWARAEVQQTRGLNLNHNHTLKNIFKGAATTVVTQLETEPLRQDYQRLITAGTINEPSRGSYYGKMFEMGKHAEAPTPVVAEEVVISASVSASFEIAN